MTRASLYAGPGKLYMSSVGLWADGETGQISLAIEQAGDPFGASLFGTLGETRAGSIIRVNIQPFDNWSALALLFPTAYKTPTIGARYPTADTACEVWTYDQRLFTVQASFVSQPPELHLGSGVGLFGNAEITGVIKDNADVGDADAFLTIETGQADPGGTFALTDFIRGAWTGVWGSVTGFDAVQAEDEWIITPELRWTPLSVQKQIRAFTLDSVRYMARCRPVGPTQAQILTAMKIQDSGVLGGRFGTDGANLTLTGPSSKTVTLAKAMLKTAGYEFGGTRLGNGEIGFVCEATITTGAHTALITFSA